MFFIHKRDIRRSDIKRGRGAGNVHNVYHQKMLRRKDRLRRKYNYSKIKGNNKAKQLVQAKLLKSIHRRNGRVLAKVPHMQDFYYELPYKQALSLMSSKLREERIADLDNDAASVASDTTTDSFDIVMQMVDNMMAEFDDTDTDDDDANEPIVFIDFNGMVPF